MARAASTISSPSAAIAAAHRSKISWTQVETGSAITWKYPSCILRGDGSRGEFYSIAISNGYQQVDSGTKMIHLGKDTSSRIISKGIAAGHSNNTYRGLVSAHRRASNARNFTHCDSLLIGDKCGAHTVPYIEAKNASATFEHEATTSKISDDQLFYCLSRGLSAEEAVALIVNGFVRDVLQQLPMEFMAETQKLIGISLEGSVGMKRTRKAARTIWFKPRRYGHGASPSTWQGWATILAFVIIVPLIGARLDLGDAEPVGHHCRRDLHPGGSAGLHGLRPQEDRRGMALALGRRQGDRERNRTE